MVDAKSQIKGALRLTGRSITALWLILFYLFSIWLVLGALSSHMFQEKIENVQSSSGRAVTMAVVIEALREIDDIEIAIEESKLKLNDAEKKMQSIQSERNAQDIKYDKTIGELNDRKSRIEKIFERKGLALNEHKLSPPDDVIRNYLGKDAELKSLYEEYADAERSLQETERQLERLTLKLENAKIDTLNERRHKRDLNKQRLELTSKHGVLLDHLSELKYMRGLYFDRLARMPNQLLTLILALSMGALGSVIFLTRTFMDRSIDKRFSWYIFRPFLGMVTALAIFILAKAGQIIISDASISQGISNRLNPFFISFLAIISGILSEQAYEKIQSSGGAFFRVEPKAKQRWAFRLKEELGRKGKKASEIAGFTDTTKKVVEEWINETRAVPEREQELISVWLGINVRDLFTDQPPPSPRE